MKFQDFLDEGLSTAHGKVEMALRELGIKYISDVMDHGKSFRFNGFTLMSFNNGDVFLMKGRTEIDAFRSYDIKDVRQSVVDMVKKHIKVKETAEA